MKEKIQRILKEIEKKNNIKILFAVESGSRAWGIESKDSYYDVRFVFVRPLNHYLSLHKVKDVIDYFWDSELDFVGFDIYKFSNLLVKSNPSTIEWLKSEIIYVDDGITRKEFIDFIDSNYSVVALFNHYKSMGKQNYLKYLKSQSLLTHKKYLYALRGIINAIYVYYNRKIPSINFNEMINSCNDIVPNDVLVKLKEIIELKKNGLEREEKNSIPLFNSYIENVLRYDYEISHSKKPDINKLNKFVIKTIKEVK